MNEPRDASNVNAASKKPPHPHGPRGRLLMGSLPERRKKPLKLYMEGALNYGDVVFYKMGPMRVYQLNNPDHIKHVLADNQKNYFKGKGYDKLFPVLGNGLLLSHGEFWHRQRRLAQPAFHRQRLAGFVETMCDSTDAMIERWKEHESSGASFDVAREMMRLTLGIVSRTLLSTDVSDAADAVGAALSRLLEEANIRTLSVLPWERLPLPRNSQFRKDLATLNGVVYRIIEERRKTGADAGDLLSMLMHAKDEDTGEMMNDRQLRDEVMTMFLAGHETTANLLAWTWYLLSKHPEIARRVRAEVIEVLGDRKPQFDDVPKLRYSMMVLEEALRLYPPAWVFARENHHDDVIGGYRIPAGSIIVLVPYVVHRLPNLWQNPEGFDPERFSPENAAGRHKYAYFPFGGGPRFCIGNNFALTEALVILAMVIRRYRLDLVPGQFIEPEPLITLRPKKGVKMTVSKQP